MKTLTIKEKRMLVKSFNFVLSRIKSPIVKDDHSQLFRKVLSDYEVKPESKINKWWRNINK